MTYFDDIIDRMVERTQEQGLAPIALVRADWLIRFSKECNTPLPKRQELENYPENDRVFISKQELEASLKFDDDAWYSRIVAINYPWMDKNHPDSQRTTLQRVAKSLELYQAEFGGPLGVFFDYVSLYQSPRTIEQAKVFTLALKGGTPWLFMHPHTIVFRLMKVHLEREDGSEFSHNELSLMDRGWGYAESCWASYVKQYRESVFDIDNVLDVDHYSKMENPNHRKVPDVQLFREEMQQKSFTNRRDDLPAVEQMIQNSHDKMLKQIFMKMDTLYYNGLGWDDSDIDRIFEFLRQGYGPCLVKLDLSNNVVVNCFEGKFDRLFQHCKLLVELNLGGNPIGNDGVVQLASCMRQLKRIHLRDVDLDQNGCRLLNAKLLAVTESIPLKIEVLDLSDNAIGDEGVQFLSPVLVDIKCLSLQNVGLSEVGCEALLLRCYDKDDVNSVWDKLDLLGNQIQFSGTLISLKKRCKNLNYIGNPIHSRSFHQLADDRDAHSAHQKDFESIIEGNILKAVKSGAVAFLSADWLIEFARKGRSLPFRQQLHEMEGSILTLKKLGIESDQFWCRRLVILSYMWQSKEHPDPLCTTLQLVVRALTLLKEEFKGDFGLFWDFASLYQHPDESKDKKRSQLQELRFSQGLSTIASLFMHPDTFVFQVTELPTVEGFQMIGHSAVRYEQRGWPFTEQSWSSLAKRFSGSVYNLSRLGDGREYQDLHQRCAVTSQCVPHLPKDFNALANHLRFGKEGDRDKVKQLYKDSFVQLFIEVRELNYEKLQWSLFQARQFLDVIQKVENSHLERLDLSGNALTARFCFDLNEAFQKRKCKRQLSILDLSNNPLGNKGFVLLAPIIAGLSALRMRNIGVNEDGCQLIKTFFERRRPVQHNRLKVLNLSNNPIRDKGLATIFALFPCLDTLKVRYAHCSELGCTAVEAETVSHHLEKLDLYGNQLKTCGSLVRLVCKNHSKIRLLDVAKNPIRDRSLHQLVKCCKKRVEIRF